MTYYLTTSVRVMHNIQDSQYKYILESKLALCSRASIELTTTANDFDSSEIKQLVSHNVVKRQR